MRVFAKNCVYLLCPVPANDSQTRPGTPSLLRFRTVSARRGPCPGQMFSYSNKTKNPLPVLAIPGSFIEFPGSLHPLVTENIVYPKNCFPFKRKCKREEKN